MDWLSGILESTSSTLDGLSIVRALLAFILMFFLPGFAWTLVFFRRINVKERVVLSVGLSIAVVILSLLSLNMLAGIRINGFNSILIVIAVTIIPIAIYYFSRLIRGRLSRG